MSGSRRFWAGIVAFVAGAGVACAQFIPDGQLASRTQLNAVVVAPHTDTFESFTNTSQLHLVATATLDSSLATAFGGPGLVSPSVAYTSPSGLYINVDGYYNLPTYTLGDSAVSGPITITYTSPVNAFGFDLLGYNGFGQTGTIQVFDTSNNLLGSVAVNGGFFGWKSTSVPIGHVVISATGGDYIMIDNHTFSAIPEPGTFALLTAGLGLLGLTRRRRK